MRCKAVEATLRARCRKTSVGQDAACERGQALVRSGHRPRSGGATEQLGPGKASMSEATELTM